MRRKNGFKIQQSFKLALIAAIVISMEQSVAVAAPVFPASVGPEQQTRALQSQQPVAAPRPLAPVERSDQKAEQPLGPQAEKIKFQLNGIVLEGNHVYPTSVLEQLYKDKIHKTISVADLFNVVQSITNFYRNNGYIITRAILPPQHVKNGVVKVQIIEGYIGKVDVSGQPRGAANIIQAYGQQIAKSRPLEIKRMERYLLIANEVPSTSAKAVLAPSKTQQGAADLTLVTLNRPITSYLSYDNYGTRYIGPQQMTANMGVNSAIASGDSTQLTVTKTTKGSELTYIDLNYGLPILFDGWRATFGGTRTQTHPLYVLQPANIDGLSTNYYTNVSYPMIRTRSESLTFQGSFTYLDSMVNSFDEQLYTDHIRPLDLGLVYNFADRWYGANLIGVDFNQGLPILGYSSNYNPSTAQTSRPGGRGDYTKFNLQLSRLQALTGPFSLYGVFKGQWAFNPLLAAQQFTFGGSQLGRGYDVAELIGDKGLAASLEGRYDVGIGRLWVQSLQPYAFYDFGSVWNFKNIGGTPTKQTAMSFGGGTRFYFTQYVSGNFMWAQPITKQVAALQLIGDGKGPRMFFSVVAQFG